LQKYLEADFLRDLLASIAAGVVTLDLNPAGGWVSDEASRLSVDAWTGISDWDSWDSSAWRGGSEEMERWIRGLGNDASELEQPTGASGVGFLSESLFGLKTIAMPTAIWRIDDEQFGIFPENSR